MKRPRVFTVTYSKDGAKKPKTGRWHDGQLRVGVSGEATLLLDATCDIVVASVPNISEEHLLDKDEEFELEPRLLVIIDSLVGSQQVEEPTKSSPFKAMAGPQRRKSFALPRAHAQPQSQGMQHQPLHTTSLTQNFSERSATLACQQRSNEEILCLLGSVVPPPCGGDQCVDDRREKVNRFPALPQEASTPPAAKKRRIAVPKAPHARNDQSTQQPAFPAEPSLVGSPAATSTAPGTNARTTLPWRAQRPVALPQTDIASCRFPPAVAPQHNSWQPAPQSHVLPSTMPATSHAAMPLQLHGPSHLGNIRFPSKDEAARPQRRVVVPDYFPTAGLYCQVWENALGEEVTLRLAEVAKAFHATVAASTKIGGKEGSLDGAALEPTLRRARVPYYGSCELLVWRNYTRTPNVGRRGHGKQKKGQMADDPEGAPIKPEQTYLILKSGRFKATDYHRGDIWVVSSHPLLQGGFDPSQPGDRTKAPWVRVARSLWHGPNQDGKFEIQWLTHKPPSLGRSQPVYALKGPDASMELSLLDLLRRDGLLQAMPLLPHLLGTKHSSTETGFKGHQLGPSSTSTKAHQHAAGDGANVADCDAACTESQAHGEQLRPLQQVEEIITRFNLNPDQALVIQHVASWANAQTRNANETLPQPSENASIAPPQLHPHPPQQRAPHVCLIHGPFGTGKSSLLVALVHLIISLRGRPNPNLLAGARVLVSAHTNVAVDRVFLGLAESGCTDFLRVGPYRRIDRRLLPHSLHASESRATATAAAELKEMLREATDPAEIAVLNAELAAVAHGAERHRRKLLRTCPVVGVTCCSSLLPVLDNQTFDIVILDECSQMVEPLSLAPCIRAKCRFLVAAGDPLQLPPVVASPAAATPPEQLNVASDSKHALASPTAAAAAAAALRNQTGACAAGLVRPLFVRLATLGVMPHLLRRQYRCHPAIAAVPNAHFYGGKLLDGCTPAQRPSLLNGLPPVVFLAVHGQEQFQGRSIANEAESKAVVRVVEEAIAAGVAKNRIGVICFFRAQAAMVKIMLDRHAVQLARSTGHKPRQGKGMADACAESHAETDGRHSHSSDTSKEKTEDASTVDVNEGHVQVATVDAFQGAEKDVIVLTTATTRPGAFASDACRLNVALTRARHNLIIVGHAAALQRAAPALDAVLKTARATPGGFSPTGFLPTVH